MCKSLRLIENLIDFHQIPKHTVTLFRNYLWPKEEQVMVWPPQSLDLIIESLWDYTKRQKDLRCLHQLTEDLWLVRLFGVTHLPSVFQMCVSRRIVAVLKSNYFLIDKNKQILYNIPHTCLNFCTVVYLVGFGYFKATYQCINDVDFSHITFKYG